MEKLFQEKLYSLVYVRNTKDKRDRREKIVTLSLAKECHFIKFDLIPKMLLWLMLLLHPYVEFLHSLIRILSTLTEFLI
jgi:hypothetical protein